MMRMTIRYTDQEKRKVREQTRKSVNGSAGGRRVLLTLGRKEACSNSSNRAAE
jgi:hypothetical protein